MKQKNFRIHENPVTLFLQVLTIMLISDIFFFLIEVLFDFAPKKSLFINILTAQEEFFFAILAFQFLLINYIFVQWIFNYYWFENNLLRHHQGIIWKHTQEYILPEIETTTCSKSLLGRIFDFGTVWLVFSNSKYCLRRVPHPEKFISLINEEKNRRKAS